MLRFSGYAGQALVEKLDRMHGLPSEARSAKDGGARRDRTDDLLNANQMLFQLSYGPGNDNARPGRFVVVVQRTWPLRAAPWSAILKITKCDRRNPNRPVVPASRNSDLSRIAAGFSLERR